MPATHRLPASRREHDRLAEEIDCVLDAGEARIFEPRRDPARAPDPLLAGVTGYADLEAADARETLRIVLAALSDRSTPAEAQDLAAQLAEPWCDVVWKARRDGVQKMDREQFVARVARELDVDVAEAVLRIRAVVAALEDRVSPGEMRQVLQQLPRDLQEVVLP